MHNNSTPKSTGDITIKETKRGIEFHAFNHERRRSLHIGTIKQRVYEKVAAVLEKPVPSFSLPVSEYKAIVKHAAEFIRIVPLNRDATYSISVQDFMRWGIPYDNQFYGRQMRVPLTKFNKVSTTAPRNAAVDAPVTPSTAPLWEQGSFLASQTFQEQFPLPPRRGE